MNHNLPDIIAHHDNDKAVAYLKTRGLIPFPGFYYVPILEYNGKVIRESVCMVSYNLMNEVSLIETRSTVSNSYDKLYVDKKSIPIWNIDKISSSHTVIITESIIDAETINQNINIDGVIAISTYRASFTLAQFHFIIAMCMDKNVIMAYDNDEAGDTNEVRFVNYAKNKYGKEINRLSYPYKDINEFYLTTTRSIKLLKSSIMTLI